MVVGFCSFGVDSTLGDGCGIWEHLHSFRELKCLHGFSKILWMGIKNLKVLPISGWTCCSHYNGGFPTKTIPDWILWVTNFRFLFYENWVQNHWGHKILRFKLRTPILTVLVQLPLEWNTYLLFNSDVVNFVWKTNEREEESVIFLIFFLWQCLKRRWVKVCQVGQKVLFRASWNYIFFQPGFKPKQ